jgi:hypothetical protein
MCWRLTIREQRRSPPSLMGGSVLETAVARTGSPLWAGCLCRHHLMSPDTCLIKPIPLNPTTSARSHGLVSACAFAGDDPVQNLVLEIEGRSFRCIVSVGHAEGTSLGTSGGQLALLSPCTRQADSGRS